MLAVTRCLFSVALALLVFWAPSLAPIVGAVGDESVAEWCEVDPEVVIRTPAGNVVVLHVTNYGRGTENLPALQAARIVPFARPAGDAPRQATEAEVLVLVPLGPGGRRFATRSVVSTGANATGHVLATASGESGQLLQLAFRLALP